MGAGRTANTLCRPHRRAEKSSTRSRKVPAPRFEASRTSPAVPLRWLSNRNTTPARPATAFTIGR